MDRKEPDFGRIKKAIRGEKPDRTPYLEFWIGNQPLQEQVLGRRIPGPPINFYNNPLPAALNVEFATKTGMDGVVIDYIYRPNTVGKILDDGSENYMTGNIKGWDDLKNLEEPLPYDFLRKKIEEHVRAIEGTKLKIAHTFTGVLDPVYLAMGLTDFMYKVADDMRFVETLMDIFLARAMRAINIALEYDEVEMFLINDDIAHSKALFLKPSLMEKIWYPRIKVMAGAVKSRGKILAYHTDGCITDAIPMLLDMGFDAVHPVEPYGNDIYALKSACGDRITFIGNIEIGMLESGTEEEIRKDVKNHIGRLAYNSRYIVSSSNSITTKVPYKNFMAMIDTVLYS